MVDILGDIGNWGKGAMDTVYNAINPSQQGSGSGQGGSEYTAEGYAYTPSASSPPPQQTSQNNSGGSPTTKSAGNESGTGLNLLLAGAGALGGYIAGEVAKAQGGSGQGGSEYNAEGYSYAPYPSDTKSPEEKPSKETSAASTSIISDDKSGKPSLTDKYAEQKGDFTATWTEPTSDRPGYRNVEDLGLDRKTYSLISEGYTPIQAVTMRLNEETNPRTIRELNWQQGQLLENKIEVSSGYHHWGKDTGQPVAINPFENTGDMALAIKQETGQEGKFQISKSNPSVASIFADMPKGKGPEDNAWDTAMSGYTTKGTNLLPAINKMESSKNDLGVYGGLNSNRDYTSWNKSHPNAQVDIISPMELLTGKTQAYPPTQTTKPNSVSEKKTVQEINRANNLKYNPDYHIFDDIGLGTGYKGRKDKSIANLGSFGSKSKNSHKTHSYNPQPESSILQQMGITQPFNQKKHQKKPLGDIRYPNKKGSFQTMRKNYPNSSKKQETYPPTDESAILQEMGLVQKPAKTITKDPKKNQKKTSEPKFWGI